MSKRGDTATPRKVCAVSLYFMTEISGVCKYLFFKLSARECRQVFYDRGKYKLSPNELQFFLTFEGWFAS